MAMTCEEVQSSIELFALGDSRTESDEIQSHLAGCPTCRTLEREYRQIVKSLKQSAPFKQAHIDYERDVVRAVAEEIGEMTPRPVQPFRWVKLCAMAACLLVMLGMWLWSQGKMLVQDKTSVYPAKLTSYLIPAQATSVPTSGADNIVVRDRDMFLLQDNGAKTNLVAINTETGNQVWDSNVDSYGHLLLGKAQLYCVAPSQNGGLDLVAIDAKNGQTLWRHTQNRPRLFYGLCTPVFLPNDQICWTVGHTIHVLRSADGEILWTQNAPGEHLLSTAVADDHSLYIAGTKGLYQLDPNSGKQLWHIEYEFAISRWMKPLLAITENRLCVALRERTGQSVLICVNLRDRKALWTKTLPPISHLCMTQERLYVRSQNIQALDLASGDLLWNIPSAGCSPITYADGRIWFMDARDQGALISLDASSGSPVSALAGLRSCNALVDLNDRAFVKTHDGAVHVIHLGG